MASAVPFMVSPYTFTYSKTKLQFQVRVQSSGGRYVMLSSNSITKYGTSFIGLQEKNRILINRATSKQNENKLLIDGGNRRVKSGVERKRLKDAISKDLEVLWDDGYGTKTVKDYLEGAREISMPDGGPPRWFCPVECGQPLDNSPVLLFLPGLDGVGLGLTLHHKSLGKVFEVHCLHIPISDRTPFEGLVKLVEEAVRFQHLSSPNKPIYLVGESLGGCLALTVAARYPKIDFVVILVNPGTSFDRSLLQAMIPVLEILPEGLCDAVPYLLSSNMGNPLKMAMADIKLRLPPKFKFERLLANLIEFQTYIPDAINIKETLLWKLKLLNSAAASANSHLHDVKAEVLVIASGNDCLLPSRDEAERLQSSLQNCTIRHFEDNGHTLLLEEGFSLLTSIKVSGQYRRSRRHDIVSDFLPPSMSELKCFSHPVVRFLRIAGSSAMFSTMADGRIVRGLAGVPDEGPVILVGNHMLIGAEVYSLVEEFLRQKKIIIHGIAHPALLGEMFADSSDELSPRDCFQIMGAVPVTPFNFFSLLSAKKHVLLYPGGAREALHNKGEEYTLIWPDEPEFVRMAARFGATIVPFGSVGEDDIISLDLDYNDLMKIPLVNDFIKDFSGKAGSIRDESKGEVANEEIYLPALSPKVPPGRIYTLFGKPIETKGKEEKLMKDREYAKEMYLQVQTEIRRNIDYLLKKRDEDPYRNIFDRTLYRVLYSILSDIPTFDP
ncbi:phytyl ester synthase 1, chloroplastic-like [Euphorbia lathyris]|uniref:phytyl ester synthase 1, chloroplastic-like n=1 Tax=Euphorbia lathyris TaxID=212925 RepID=UPI0033132BDC